MSVLEKLTYQELWDLRQELDSVREALKKEPEKGVIARSKISQEHTEVMFEAITEDIGEGYVVEWTKDEPRRILIRLRVNT